MKDRTVLIRHKVSITGTDPVATPIFQTSAFRSGDKHFYTRNSNPNFEELEEILSELDHGKDAVVLSSGMAAIASVLHLLKPGDSLLVNKLIYGCSYRFIADFCSQFNITLQFVDLTDQEEMDRSISKSTTMILFETPTNPFLKTINIREVTSLAHTRNPYSLIVVDNTWATPLFQKPLMLGADIVIYSGSKFFSGHSDTIIGAVIAQTEDIASKIRKYRFYAGSVSDPFNAWLTRRSLQTLDVRMAQHVNNTKIVYEFLSMHQSVSELYWPKIDGKQLTSYGGLMFIRLSFGNYDQVNTFINALKYFDFGTSMASVTSAVACPYFGSHLSMSEEEKKGVGLDEFVIRLSIGIEDVEDLVADLDQALLIAMQSCQTINIKPIESLGS